MRKLNSVAVLIVSTLVLGACGGTGQDDADVESVQTQFKGVAVDGYLARALVYVDTNDNQILDSWEPRAFTDNDGRYTTSLTGTNYCVDASAANYDFCLRSNVSLTSGVIRIEGGYDVATGEPFRGSLSHRITIVENENVENTVVTPLTTLFENVTDSTARAALLTALGIVEADLTIDFLAQDANSAVNGKLFALALKVQKIVSMLSSRLEQTYEDFGDEEGLPGNSMGYVYQALVEVLSSSTAPITIDTLLDNSGALGEIFATAETQVRSAYTDAELDLPTVIIPANGNASVIQTLLNGAIAMDELIDSVINGDVEEPLSDVVAGSRAVEVLVQKVIDEEANVNTAFDFFILDNSLKTMLLSILGTDSADLYTLIKTDFSTLDVGNLEETATFDSSTPSFGEMQGKQLHVADELETGSSPKDAEVIFYFNANGTLSACVKWIDSVPDENGQPEDSDNTLGKLVSGNWALINNGYSALITLRIAGTKQQAIVKVAESSTSTKAFRFDFNDDFDVWGSNNGLVTQNSVPSSNTACRELLPPRLTGYTL